MISMAGKAIRRWWALFALPTFAAFIIGFVVPFLMGVYLSFCEFTTVTDGEWVGLKNYGKALQDKEFPACTWLLDRIHHRDDHRDQRGRIRHRLHAHQGDQRDRTCSVPCSSCRILSAASSWLYLAAAAQRHSAQGAKALTYSRDIWLLGPGHSGLLAANRLHDDHLHRRHAVPAHRRA